VSVLMVVDRPLENVDLYDAFAEEMGVVTAADLEPECCMHLVAGTPAAGLLIVDVWKSADAMGRFAQARLIPAVKRFGLPSMQPRVMPLHRHIGAGRGRNPGVAMVMVLQDLSPDGYDRVTADPALGIGEDGRDHPAVSHTVGLLPDGGLIVVDVWDSADHYRDFAEHRLRPVLGGRLPDGTPRFEPVFRLLRPEPGPGAGAGT
jgi:hypothetical protein